MKFSHKFPIIFILLLLLCLGFVLFTISKCANDAPNLQDKVAELNTNGFDCIDYQES